MIQPLSPFEWFLVVTGFFMIVGIFFVRHESKKFQREQEEKRDRARQQTNA
ncbi:hypothetical protein P3G55_19405 [Leptospira sp. 96542]|nr:hypothetical protein [Leptospira sp. 96542]